MQRVSRFPAAWLALVIAALVATGMPSSAHAQRAARVGKVGSVAKPARPALASIKQKSAQKSARARAKQPSRIQRDAKADTKDVKRLHKHIGTKWKELTRNVAQASLTADPKFLGEHKPVIYISATENLAKVQEQLSMMIGKADLAKIQIRRLKKGGKLEDPGGLLYVPHPYVVPGGRFNEMYGWDSYFIQKGLLRDNRNTLAKGMTDNHLYEVRHYGKVLNASRAWSLTRSQPPLLTRMVLDVYKETRDKKWLAESLDTAEQYYAFWTKGTRQVKATRLSRFYDNGRGAPAEVTSSGPDEYERTQEYFREQAKTEDVSRYFNVKTGKLTAAYFKGERAGRESGYDTSNRFGPFGADTHHYNPVDLNSLLYAMERDMSVMARTVGRPAQARKWRDAAAKRKKDMDTHLWDAKRGMYFDYNFETKQRSDVVFASTFLPLWAKAASPAQAKRVVENLHLLEAPGGLLTSDRRTGHQWDAPMGWAPLIHFAVGGLRNYGYHAEANRISVNFLSLVLKEFRAHGEVFEKYDVVDRHADTGRHVKFGYTTNESGFGWTNGVVADLYASLPKAEQRKVDPEGARKSPSTKKPAKRPRQQFPEQAAAAMLPSL